METDNPIPRANRRRHDPEDSEAHAHRRRTDEDAVIILHARIDDHDRHIKQILESQRDFSEYMKMLTANTGRLADVLEAWNNVKGFWWTMKVMAGGAKILIPLIAFCAAIWFFLKTGQWDLKA